MTSPSPVLRLTLYVAGQTPRAERAMAHLRDTVEESTALAFELEIVDVLERPDLAEAALILATPTLVKEAPLPARRLIGDLADTQKVLEGLHVALPQTAGLTSSVPSEVPD